MARYLTLHRGLSQRTRIIAEPTTAKAAPSIWVGAATCVNMGGITPPATSRAALSSYSSQQIVKAKLKPRRHVSRWAILKNLSAPRRDSVNLRLCNLIRQEWARSCAQIEGSRPPDSLPYGRNPIQQEGWPHMRRSLALPVRVTKSCRWVTIISRNL